MMRSYSLHPFARHVHQSKVITAFVGLVLCSTFAQLITAQETIAIRFEDVTRQSQVDFVHSDGGFGNHYLYEAVTGGVATFDYDDDGLIDIYFTTGIATQHSKGAEPHPGMKIGGVHQHIKRLYRNLGNGNFTEVTTSAGLNDLSFGMGIVSGDYDNDGDADLFLNNFGQNVLYINNGDGTFEKSACDELQEESRLGAGALMLDFDADGNLDLWVGNYVRFDANKQLNRVVLGVPAAPGPKDYDADTDQLYRNNGDGSFTEHTHQAGIATVAGTSMGMIALDYDGDGDTDVFVCNDGMENYLWQNDGSGRFTELAQIAGVAYDFRGSTQASMGVDCVDLDHDGWLDLIATNFDAELPNVYMNVSGQYFDDTSVRWGMGAAARDVKWGIVVSDFDLDSWNDLLIATGHLYEDAIEAGSARRFASLNRLFRNMQGNRFSELSDTIQIGLIDVQSSRGIAADDLDRDGDVDLVVVNLNAAPNILMNQCQSAQRTRCNWLAICLVGTQSNRDAVGSKVTVIAGNDTQCQEVHRGRGYQSHYGNWLYFGLDDTSRVDEIRIAWHGGETQSIQGTSANQFIKIIEPH